MGLFRTTPEGVDPAQHMAEINAQVQEKLTREREKVMANPWKQKAANRGEGEERELPPEGNQPAVLVGLIDLGNHWSEYQGKGSYRHKIYLVWELVEAEGRPLVGRDFTLSLHENAQLRQWLASWGKTLGDGEEFDLSLLAGKGCLLDVKHKTTKKGKKVASVESIGALPVIKGKRVEVADPHCKPVVWSLGDDEALIPDWAPYLYGRSIHDWIKECQERNGGNAVQHTSREADPGVNVVSIPPGDAKDDIPW